MVMLTMSIVMLNVLFLLYLGQFLELTQVVHIPKKAYLEGEGIGVLVIDSIAISSNLILISNVQRNQ